MCAGLDRSIRRPSDAAGAGQIRSRRLASASLAGALAIVLTTPPAAAGDTASSRLECRNPPSLSCVLERAGRYVAELHEQLAGIVAEETYVQRVWPAASSGRPGEPETRTLRSHLLLVRPPGSDRYVEFRDVFDIDGSAVRDGEDRLTALFREAGPTGSSRLQAIINESARYNVGAIARTVNTPMLALGFLHPSMQERFRFRRSRDRAPAAGHATWADDPLAGSHDRALFRTTVEMWVIEFQERRRPTVIRTTAGADFPARGRAWIDPETGAVLMTELRMKNAEIDAAITVSYQSVPLLGFQVPAAMQERYRGRGERIEATARYGRFRHIE